MVVDDYYLQVACKIINKKNQSFEWPVHFISNCTHEKISQFPTFNLSEFIQGQFDGRNKGLLLIKFLFLY
jgi:hypothetical protein